jgi:hypothetical protein
VCPLQSTSAKKVVDDFAVDVGQAEVAAGVSAGVLLVVFLTSQFEPAVFG